MTGDALTETSLCLSEPSTDNDGWCSLTLEAAIQLALERNVDLYNRRQNRKEQRLQLAIAENPWRPKFTIGTSTQARPGDVTGDATLSTTIRVPTGGNVSLTMTQPLYGDEGERQTLGFSQPLFQGAGPAIATIPVRSARLSERENILNFRQSVAGLVNQVISSYRTLSAALRQVEISTMSLERTKNQRDSTQALIRAGRLAVREANRSNTAIANAELSLERVLNSLDQAQSNLISILELDPSLRIRPLEELATNTEALTNPPDLEEVLDRRTDYRISAMSIERAEMNLAQVENSLLPDINLNFSMPLGEDPSLGLGATFPLSDGNERALRILQARNGLERAKRSRIEMRTNIAKEVRSATNDVAVTLRIAELARDALALAQNNLAVERTRFEQGLLSATDFTAAEQELASAEESEKDALVGYLNALTRLDTVTGQTLERWGISVEALEP